MSVRVNVSTVAVAIVATTAVTATLWILLIRMGGSSRSCRLREGVCGVDGIGDARDSLSVIRQRPEIVRWWSTSDLVG